MLRGLRLLASADDDPSDRSPGADFWYGPAPGMLTAAGVRVSPESALRSTTVFACTRLIAQTIGSVPLITYQRLLRGKQRAAKHPLYRLLRHRPNRWQTALEFYEMMTAHCALRGNAYARKIYTRGLLVELVPLHPDSVRADELPNGRLRYIHTDKAGQMTALSEEEVFHLRGMSSDGKHGLSVIGHGATSIGIAIAADLYGARFFANDATPSGVLKHPQHFKDGDARRAFAKDWERMQAGRNQNRTAVLEDGLSYEHIGMTNTDAQFLEARRFQVADIARLFGVPLQLLGETEKATTWGSGVEQIMNGFVIHTIRPWCVRWEQAIQRDFFAEDEQVEDEFFAEFLITALLRGDQKSRYTAYGQAIKDGWMTRNEAREAENMNPLDGLDEPLEPLNMARAGEDRGTDTRSDQDDKQDEAED